MQCLRKLIFFFLIHRKINSLSISPSSSEMLLLKLGTEQKGPGGELPHVVLPLTCIFLALAPHYRLGTVQIKMLGDDSYMVLEGAQSQRT